jgi:hypothetical protein
VQGCPGAVMWEQLSGMLFHHVAKVRGLDSDEPPYDVSGTRLLSAWQDSSLNFYTSASTHLHGDNEATVAILRSGRNPTMRHLGRAHGTNLRWIHDEVVSGRMALGYIETTRMRADIITKFYPKRKAETWRHVKSVINVLEPGELERRAGACGPGHAQIVRNCVPALSWKPKHSSPLSSSKAEATPEIEEPQCMNLICAALSSGIGHTGPVGQNRRR